MKALHRLFCFFAFILILGLACHLLDSSRLMRLFHPLNYRAEIDAAAAEQKIDPLLIAAVIQAESNFRKNAVSSEGARGLMQLMPSTAEWIASQNEEGDFDPDKLFEPSYNIAAGSRYLADLLRQFDGNRVIALAAYNGGRGRVQRWLEKGVWDGSEADLARIPFGETRAFVKRVLKNYRIYRHLYGEDFKQTDPAPAVLYSRACPENQSAAAAATANWRNNRCIKLL